MLVYPLLMSERLLWPAMIYGQLRRRGCLKDRRQRTEDRGQIKKYKRQKKLRRRKV